MESALFCRFNKKSKANETKEPKAATVTEELNPKVIKEPEPTEKPIKK
jgi:hypothetical protein